MTADIFPFLQLATEIRLLIYKLVLPYSEYKCEREREEIDCPVVWYQGVCPAILFVNRQVHYEATEMLYGENVFALYVRHPREPRLPMNESRADLDNFLLFSWANRSWANPRNPRMSCSILKHHANFENIKRIHVSLPPLNDLIGVDVYMQKSSYAAFNGINAWVSKCLKAGGSIDYQERDRMDYVRQTKRPIDEVADLLETLPRIENLYLSLQLAEVNISFTTFMLQGLLALRNVNTVRVFHAARLAKRRMYPRNQADDCSLLGSLKQTLEDPVAHREKIHLSDDMDDMFRLLQSIRARQQLDPSKIPNWLNAMPE